MKVCLTRKFAEAIDGIDLSASAVGDVLDLDPSKARLLIAEDWAFPDRRAAPAGRRQYVSSAAHPDRRQALAADRPSRSELK
jgi:hypothetical protein